PLMVERLREKLSNESMADRIARLLGQLEQAAGPDSTQSDASLPPDLTDHVRGALSFGREHDQPPASKAARTPRTGRTSTSTRSRAPK
nr:hypothetical protein [Serpentinimonas sp.]